MDLKNGPKMSARQRIAVVVILTLVGVIFFAWLINWRFKTFRFLNAPEVNQSADLGFRFNLPKLRCENRKGEAGLSPGFFGTCGNIAETNMHRVRIEDLNMIGIAFHKVDFRNFLIDWMIAPSSVWDSVRFELGEFGDADLRGAFFRNVVFENVDFEGAWFAGARFDNCVFRNVRMQDVSFRFGKFTNSSFENVRCHTCDFRNAEFDNSGLSGQFAKSFYNERSVLPIATEDLGPRGFEYLR